MKFYKNTLKFSYLFLFVALATSCNGIYENMEPCPTWEVQFLYKKHPQALTSLTGQGYDAFSESVRAIQLFVYDSKTGDYVADFTASGDELGSGKWIMPIDLKPGEYDFVAWGHGHADKSKAFQSLKTTKSPLSRHEHAWRVVRDEDRNNLPWNEEEWNPVNAFFYGESKGNIVKEDKEDHRFQMELTKNTNHLNVTVQFSSNELTPNDFYVQWVADNGHLDAFNNPVKGDILTYKPFKEFTLVDDAVIEGNEVVEAGTKYSSIGVSRMMVDHQGDAKLEIRNTKDDSLIYSIDLLKLICNLHEGDDESDQYYLDCQDTYNCHFMLQSVSGQWLPFQIHINDWVVVPEQNNEF